MRAIAAALSLACLMPIVAQAEIEQRISAESVLKGLNVSVSTVDRSDRGLRRERWGIPGVEGAQLELIGNDRADADSLSWRCVEYRHDGSYASLRSKGSSCRAIAVKILAHFVAEPDLVFDVLVAQPTQKQLDSPAFETDAMRLQATSDGYGSVRKRATRR
ncbi:hypothetical protein [Stagnimonas aquatica]|nr:hypothetical protein [Stagnimonas aquatica]